MAVINGTSGNDTLIGSGTFNAGDGDDVVVAIAPDNIIRGEGGNDTLVGRGNDLIEGGDGDDLILAAGDSNVLHGGAGNDTIHGGDRGDIFYGGSGNDHMIGGLGVDVFYDDSGDNIFEMGTAQDVDAGVIGDIAYGGNGNDIYRMAYGAGIMDTGGIDTLDFSGLTEDQHVGTFDMQAGVFNGSTASGTYTGWNYSMWNPALAGKDIQIMGLLDATSSMSSDFMNMGDAFQVDYSYFLRSLGFRTSSNQQIGVSVFADKPVAPYGQPTGSPADKVVLLVKPFDVQNYGWLGYHGGDAKDGQVEALLHMARNAAAFGFSPDAVKFVTVVTDSLPHLAGDFIGANPNNGDGVLDPNEDYPSVEQLRIALLDAGITPIFTVKAAVLADYELLVKQLGFGTVQLLAEDSSNLSSLIVDGLQDVLVDLLENLIGTNFNDVIYGNVKDNVIHGGAGYDYITGGAGNDTIDGGADGDNISGGEGNDRLYGTQGNDNLGGGPGDDIFYVYRVAPEAYEFPDEAAALETVYVTDTSGIDTLDFSLGRAAAQIYLDGSQYGAHDNRRIVIEANTAIENVVGTGFGDTIVGNAAANRLDGRGGADQMQGLEGNDTYVVDDISDQVIEASGGGSDKVEASISYTLTVNVEDLTLTGAATIDGTGNSGNNTIVGNAAANVLRGEAGADRLTGSGGADTLHGGTGIDTFVYTRAGDSVTGAHDVIIDWEVGEVFDLTLVDANPNAIGVQRLAFIGQGTADLAVLQGQLKYYHAAGNTYLAADTDFDGQADFHVKILGTQILTHANFDGIGIPITGNGNANTLTGGTGADVIFGLGGNDTLRGQGGNDRLVGGAGKDTLTGGGGADTYVYAAISDSAPGAASRDVITDWDGLDRFDFFALDADATLDGVQAFTFLGQGTVDHTVGQGQLKYYFAGGNTYLVGNVSADDTADFEIELTGFHTLGIEHFVNLDPAIVGTPGADALEGTEAGERILGLGGHDTINGWGGDDRIFGGAGDDTIDGGMGADAMAGGTGSDLYYVDNAGDRVIEAKSEGTDSVISSVAFSLIGQYIENLTLTGTGNFKATGNSAANILRGNDGNNLIDGREGKDQMYGGLGNDTYIVDHTGDRAYELNGEGTDHVKSSVSFNLSGQYIENLTLTGAAKINGTGNGLANILTGNGADNILNGLGGMDTLFGGAGSDAFVFSSTLSRTSNVDTILDFETGIDRIHLDRAIFSAFAVGGTLAENAFKNMALGAVDAGDRILFDQATGELFYDADGSGALRSVLFAQIDNGAVLTADDFLLI